eukprot:Seg2275.4 transcript_id=Seg2275.4/GoldUCD/mRNA.D3Y31 product="hypothetical protein" protein_id=Seg2275.4/GoldUCD/D3Y31
MSRLFIIARSSRAVDLEEVIGCYVLSTTNRTLMKADGSLLPTTGKSIIIALIEELVLQNPRDQVNENGNEVFSKKCLIIDGMAVVQEISSMRNFDNCKEFGAAFVKTINFKARGYDVTRVIFDNYSVENSMKGATRERRRGSTLIVKVYKVDDNTKIKSIKQFLASSVTKDSLTLYLSHVLIEHADAHIIIATHQAVMSNCQEVVSPGVSSQEEADTLMIFHATESAKDGSVVHIYSQDTDVLLLALRRVPLLGRSPAMVMGTCDRRRIIPLVPIYDALGEAKAKALCKWHALTGCDTTGHIIGESKKACLDAFLKADSNTVASISALGVGEKPSDEVLYGCIQFLSGLFCKKDASSANPEQVRWMSFKQLGKDKGVELLPPTHGAWEQHVLRVHLQSLVWE